MNTHVLAADELEKLRAVHEVACRGNWHVDGSDPTGFATLLLAVPDLLATIDARDAEVERLRDLLGQAAESIRAHADDDASRSRP